MARITQEIKKSLLSGASYNNLSDEQKLSLDMIANKMARAVNGDATYVDNWQDICGYGKLVVDSLKMGSDMKEYEGATHILDGVHYAKDYIGRWCYVEVDGELWPASNAEQEEIEMNAVPIK